MSLRDLLELGDLDGLVREADRLASRSAWDELLALRDACLAATEETGRQLWGPARYAGYRIALDGPAPLAASMVEPGVVRFGLGPLTEVVAQRHTFAELAPHLDAAVLPVVAQERVLRGEDLRDDPRAARAPDEPPLVLQPFEPAYVLPDYRDDERLDGAVPDPLEGAPAVDVAPAAGDAAREAATSAAARRTVRALEDVVAPWATQSGGEVRVRAVVGDVDDAVRAVLAGGTDVGAVRCATVDVATLLALLAHAGASGGVHGRRRGGAAGRSSAWWVARCITGLDGPGPVDADELEFRLEDTTRVVFRAGGEATWRLEVALGPPPGLAEDIAGEAADVGEWVGEWAVAIAAFDRSEPSHDPGSPGAPEERTWEERT